MTIPGVRKSSLQINFGKIGKSNWEVKKVDKIILTWSKPPIEFRIFTWYPGTSWILFSKISNNGIFLFLYFYFYYYIYRKNNH